MSDREHDALDALHDLEAQIEDTRWTIDDRTFTANSDGQQATLDLTYAEDIDLAIVTEAMGERTLTDLIEDIAAEYDDGAPLSKIVSRATEEFDLDGKGVRDEVERLRRQGDVYEPTTDHLRVV